MFYPKKNQDKEINDQSRMIFEKNDDVLSLDFDENVKAGKLQIDLVVLKQVMTCCYYSSRCYVHQEKINFINSIRTLTTLTVYYWILDTDFQAKMQKLNQEFTEIQDQCEPGKDNIEDGITPNNEAMIDIAVDFANKKFLLLMSIITRANKTFETQDIM